MELESNQKIVEEPEKIEEFQRQQHSDNLSENEEIFEEEDLDF